MAKEKVYIMYAAFGNEHEMKPIYEALESAGCRIEAYQTKVPGVGRLLKPNGRTPTGLLELMDGELTIVHAPAGISRKRFKEIVDPIEVSDLVDVHYPNATKRYSTK